MQRLRAPRWPQQPRAIGCRLRHSSRRSRPDEALLFAPLRHLIWRPGSIDRLALLECLRWLRDGPGLTPLSQHGPYTLFRVGAAR